MSNIEKYSLPPIGGLLSFPPSELMKYGIDHSLLDSGGLPTHIMLGRMTVDALASKLPKNITFDIDTARALTTVYHATRQAADMGKAGNHPDSSVNEFMTNRGDMDYALLEARKHGLSPQVVQGIQHYIISPSTRNNSYFPHETLSPSGEINWTETIPMLTSWLVAGVNTRADKRFDDLRRRRSAEIGKLELPFWKARIDAGETVELPKPIVDIAIRERMYADENAIIEGIQSGDITDAIMGKWILDGYEEWANHVISEYCRLTGIEDFYGSLEQEMDKIGTSNPEEKLKIRAEFEGLLGRPLGEGEFIPYVPGIDLLFKRLRLLKVSKAQDAYRIRVEKVMRNIDRVVRMLARKPQTVEGAEAKYIATQLSRFYLRPNPETRLEEFVLVIVPGEGVNIPESVINDSENMN